jgi:HlyD family secretion protein
VKRRAATLGVVLAVTAGMTASSIGLLASVEQTPAVPPVSSLRPLPAARGVGALGRIEPQDGVLRVAGPARPSAVVAELLVEEGKQVTAGEALAVLDAHAADAARVARAEAELADARAAFARVDPLVRQRVLAEALRDEERRRVAVAEADLALARADWALDTVRAPVAGRVLDVHARAGERIGPAGLLELGRTDVMYAVAEVYETDVATVRVGQRAVVRSAAFDPPLTGRVERVGLQVRRQVLLADDPTADVDARVVEVHVRLDDGTRAAALSNLEVDVVIDTETP